MVLKPIMFFLAAFMNEHDAQPKYCPGEIKAWVRLFKQTFEHMNLE